MAAKKNSEQTEEQLPKSQAETAQAEASAKEADAGADAGKKTVTMVLKHKSHTPHYHRCGLSLTKTFAEYEVSEECVGRIKADKWIVVKDGQ